MQWNLPTFYRFARPSVCGASRMTRTICTLRIGCAEQQRLRTNHDMRLNTVAMRGSNVCTASVILLVRIVRINYSLSRCILSGSLNDHRSSIDLARLEQWCSPHAPSTTLLSTASTTTNSPLPLCSALFTFLGSCSTLATASESPPSCSGSLLYFV